MGLLSFIPIIGKVIEKGLDIVDDLVPDKDLAAKLKMELQKQLMEVGQEELRIKGDLVKAEIQGASWLQRNWRPLLMLTIIAIIANNYVLVPYLAMFTTKAVILELPGGLWALLNVGVGGYVIGRTGEKIADKIAGGK